MIRLWIGEVILSFWLRLAEGLFERTPHAIASTLLIIRMASPLPIGFSLALLQPCLGGLYLGQTDLASAKLLRQLLLGLIYTQTRVLLCIGCASALQQRFNLLLKLWLLVFHAPVAHSFVLARIRLYFGAIQSNHSKLDHPQLFGQPYHLHKQLFKLGQMPKSKITNRSMRGKIARPKHPKRNILVQLSGDLARRENSRRIPVHQHFHQHRRVKRLVTPTIPFIAGIKDLQVQPIDDFDYKISQVILWQPLRRRRWQQKILHWVVRKEVGIT